MTARPLALAAVMAATVLSSAPAHSQSLAGRVALEAIASASTNDGAVDDPFLIFDLVGTVRLADGWDVVVRPWARRRPGGDWAFEWYQLQLRYVSSTRVPFRVDAGILPSPLGLATLELQPHRNPLIGAPFYYFSPLPSFDGTADRVTLMSGGYPLGAMISASGTRWDARAGVIDGTPARPRSVFTGAHPRSEPQLVLGGGLSPITGLRVGAGLAYGRYRSRATLPSGSMLEPENATVLNLEGEYAVGHTRFSGEWVRNRFDLPAGAAIARGFNVQASHTLTPRIFAAARATHASSPVMTMAAEVRRTSTALEATLGYRLNTELTVRGGYQRERAFGHTHWTHAAVASIVWAERWW